MGNILNIERFNLCNFNFGKKNNLNNICKEFSTLNIQIIPTAENVDIEDLYPESNHVILWNTFVIGRNKKYILSNIGNKQCILSKLEITNEQIVDTFGDTRIPLEFYKFLLKIWDETLIGNDIMVYVIINNITYLLNSYSLRNKKKDIIGAVLFMRNIHI